MLTLKVIKAQNLLNMDVLRNPSSYVRIAYKEKSKTKICKTKVKRSSKKPIWEETFEFKIENIKDASLSLTVFSKERTGKDLKMMVPLIMELKDLKTSELRKDYDLKYKCGERTKEAGKLSLEIKIDGIDEEFFSMQSDNRDKSDDSDKSYPENNSLNNSESRISDSSIKKSSESTDNDKDSLKNSSESTDNDKDSFKKPSESTNKDKDSFKKPSESTNKDKDSLKNFSESTDNDKDSFKKSSESTDNDKDSLKNSSESTDNDKDSFKKSSENSNQNISNSTLTSSDSNSSSSSNSETENSTDSENNKSEESTSSQRSDSSED